MTLAEGKLLELAGYFYELHRDKSAKSGTWREMEYQQNRGAVFP